VNAALSPVRGLVWGIEQIEAYVKETVTEKLSSIPLKNIRTPDPSIAGPLLQSIRFVGNKSELAQLYANLLAASMNSDTLAGAHPSFIEIIRNLSSDEAKLLSYLKAHHRLYVGWLAVDGIEASDLFLIDDEASQELQGHAFIASYIQNLDRLGLATGDAYKTAKEYNSIHYVYKSDKEELENAIHNILNSSRANTIYKAYDDIKIGEDVVKEQARFSYISPTWFGDQFLNMCVED